MQVASVAFLTLAYLSTLAEGGRAAKKQRGEADQSCSKQFGIIEKVEGGGLTMTDLNGWIGCLSSGGLDSAPDMIQFLTAVAEEKGLAGTRSEDCQELTGKD